MDSEILRPYVDTGDLHPLGETVKSLYETVFRIFSNSKNNAVILDHGRGFRILFRNNSNVVLISMVSQIGGRESTLYIDFREDGMSNFFILSPDGKCKMYYFDSDEDYKSGVSKQDMLGISSSVSNEDLLSLMGKLTSIFPE